MATTLELDTHLFGKCEPLGDINVTGITGPSGCGKSTLFELMMMLLYAPRDWQKIILAWADMSAMIGESKRRNTVAGKLLKLQEDNQNSGLMMPGEPVYQSMIENLLTIKGSRELVTFGIAGSVRTPREAELYLRHLGERFAQIHITMDNSEITHGIELRVLKGEIREDDAPAAISTKIQQYRDLVIPAVTMLPSRCVTEIEYKLPLTEKLKKAVRALNMPKGMRREMLDRLDTFSHPVHAKIYDIEHPKKSEKQNTVVESEARQPNPVQVFALA